MACNANRAAFHGRREMMRITKGRLYAVADMGGLYAFGDKRLID